MIINSVNNKKVDFLAYIEIICSFIAVIICLLFCQNNELYFFWILPFLYAIGRIAITYNNSNTNNSNTNGLAYTIINLIMFVRYSIATTLTLVSYPYNGLRLNVDSYIPTFLVMIFEMMTVFVIMGLVCKNKIGQNMESFEKIQEYNNSFLSATKFILLLITVAIAFIYPIARNTLFNFSFSDNVSVDNNQALSGFAFVFFKIGINITYAIAVEFIVKNIRSITKSFVLCSIISVIYISCNWTGAGNVSRWGLLTSALVCYIVLVKSYPKYKKIILVLGGVALIFILLMSSILKLFVHHGATSNEAILEIFSAAYLNEYFQGIYPVSNGIVAMQYHSDKINFITFLDDTISAYPIINKLFYEAGNLTETYYLSFLGMNDKILPTIAQSYAHFGYLGAPIFSGLLTFISLKLDVATRKSRNVIETVALTQIVAFTSLFMTINVFIIQRTTMYFVLMWILFFISKRILIKKGNIK